MITNYRLNLTLWALINATINWVTTISYQEIVWWNHIIFYTIFTKPSSYIVVLLHLLYYIDNFIAVSHERYITIMNRKIRSRQLIQKCLWVGEENHYKYINTRFDHFKRVLAFLPIIGQEIHNFAYIDELIFNYWRIKLQCLHDLQYVNDVSSLFKQNTVCEDTCKCKFVGRIIAQLRQ